MRVILERAAPVLSSRRQPDPSFRTLLGELAWRRLPPAVRERFSVKPSPGAEIRYVGSMEIVRASAAGWLMARLFRLIGTPLAPYSGHDVPTIVTLTLDRDGEGIVWERCYRFSEERVARCVSVKRAVPGEGLMECVGGGVGMWLTLTERGGALHFTSTGYFWRCGRIRLALPHWLTPGDLHVAHIDLGGARFRFSITVRHWLFGETFHQTGVFAEERG